MNRELAQYQRHIKDYVNKHKHNLPPEVLEKGRKQNNSSLNLQKKTNNNSSAGLVGPLPITKQVLSEEEFNQTQKDNTSNNLMPKIQTRQPSHLTQAASPKKFNHYQNPQNNIQQHNNLNSGYHRQVQGPPDGNNKRSGYNSDWDVKYQYHPPPKYNKNRPIGGNSNGAINNGGNSNLQLSQNNNNTNNNQNNSNLNNSDKMKLTAGYGTQV